ncbi:MAG: DNA-binding protein [Gammaproteobacteria bacterium]|nr:DNA-binding protein [Gammaproteobacteria bacterium]MBU1832765.1 DNA-binding protein [Gammaproteobacteria bacterium]
MNIKPIKTEADHKQALARLELLMEAQPDTPEGDELDILATLVDAYERQHHAIEPPHPVEAIRFRMEQMGLVDADLIPIIGQRGRVSEVLNFKRR